MTATVVRVDRDTYMIRRGVRGRTEHGQRMAAQQFGASAGPVEAGFEGEVEVPRCRKHRRTGEDTRTVPWPYVMDAIRS